MLFFNDSVTRLRAPTLLDRHRNPTRDWAHASRELVVGVSVQPTARTEAHSPGNRDTATSGWTLQTAPGRDVDLLATDRVELADGVVCEVVGEVARHPDPLGRGIHHVEVALQRTTG